MVTRQTAMIAKGCTHIRQRLYPKSVVFNMADIVLSAEEQSVSEPNIFFFIHNPLLAPLLVLLDSFLLRHLQPSPIFTWKLPITCRKNSFCFIIGESGRVPLDRCYRGIGKAARGGARQTPPHCATHGVFFCVFRVRVSCVFGKFSPYPRFAISYSLRYQKPCVVLICFFQSWKVFIVWRCSM